MAVIRVKITYCSLFERERRHPIFVERTRLTAEENLRRPRRKLAGANKSKDVYQTSVSNFHETPQAQIHTARFGRCAFTSFRRRYSCPASHGTPIFENSVPSDAHYSYRQQVLPYLLTNLVHTLFIQPSSSEPLYRTPSLVPPPHPFTADLQPTLPTAPFHGRGNYNPRYASLSPSSTPLASCTRQY